MAVEVTIKNIYGEFKPLNIFQYFDDGIRKRMPKNLANEVKSQLIQNIHINRYNFELSKDWQEYKKRVGADSRPFMMFSHYVNAIKVVTSDGHLSVGFPKSVIHPRAGIKISKLAVALEYGDVARGRPARPLWRNTLRDTMRERAKIEKILRESLTKRK